MLTELISSDDEKYVKVLDLIDLIAQQTNESKDVVIKYILNRTIILDSEISVFQKGIFDAYHTEFCIIDLLYNYKHKKPYTIKELEESEEYRTSYLLIKDIFNQGFIKILNLNLNKLINKNNLININIPTIQTSKISIQQLQSQLNQAHTTIKEQQTRITDLEQQLKQAQLDSHTEMSERHERSYHVTIGLLLELLTTPKGTDDKPPFQSQASIISEIVDKDIYGQKKTTLETRFSTANNALKDIKKKK
ncbi:hypothetical protein [Psychrobacter sp. I-STPA10]|uniref:hypothetical protein n=1 Tax=Psychrobacter sp. I-STPA10 TaxID=2585769 RepID=UPI001E4D262F|nr:hypothetical protein [Psychrobacter sp. I-STPA10]